MKKQFKLFIIVFCLLILPALSQAVTEQQVAELYVATFNRAPDKPGLDFWVNDSGFTIEQIAESFFDQTETQALYPAGTTETAFVTSIYNNLFNRAPNAAGLAYWVDALGSGTLTRPVMIEALKNGSLGTDAEIIANKAEVGLYYANKELQYYFSLSDITKDLSTVQAAKAKCSSDDFVFEYLGKVLTSNNKIFYSPSSDVKIKLPISHFGNGWSAEIDPINSMSNATFNSDLLSFTTPATSNSYDIRIILKKNDVEKCNFDIPVTSILKQAISAGTLNSGGGSYSAQKIKITSESNTFPQGTTISIDSIDIPENIIPTKNIIDAYEITLSNEPEKSVNFFYTLPDNATFDENDIFLIHFNYETGIEEIILPVGYNQDTRQIEFELDSFSPIIISNYSEEFKYSIRAGNTLDLGIDAQIDVDRETNALLASVYFNTRFENIAQHFFNFAGAFTLIPLDWRDATHWIKEERNPILWEVEFQKENEGFASFFGSESLGGSKIGVWPDRDMGLPTADSYDAYYATIWNFENLNDQSYTSTEIDSDSMMSYEELEEIIRGKNLVFHSSPGAYDADGNYRLIIKMTMNQRVGQYPTLNNIHKKRTLTFRTPFRFLSIDPNKTSVLADGNKNGIEDESEGGNTGQVVWYKDADLDGYSNGDTKLSVENPGSDYYQAFSLTSTSGDCNDNDIDIYSGAQEICDGIDNQCPGDTGYGTTDENCSVIEGPILDDIPYFEVYGTNDEGSSFQFLSKTLLGTSLDGNPYIVSGFDWFYVYIPENTSQKLFFDAFNLDGHWYSSQYYHIVNMKSENDLLSAVKNAPDGLSIWNNDSLWESYFGGVTDGADFLTIYVDGNDSPLLNTYYYDNDGDEYGDPNNSMEAASQPFGYVTDSTDLNDNDRAIHPGAVEICGDGIDQDCDGSDLACEADPRDVDNDGDGYTENQGDLDDTEEAIHPGAVEICGDGIDQDCDFSDSICYPNIATTTFSVSPITPNGLITSPDGSYLVVGNNSGPLLSGMVISTSNISIQSTFDIGGWALGPVFAFSHDEKFFYTSTLYSEKLFKIQTSDLSVVDEIWVGGKISKVSSGKSGAFIYFEASNSLYKYNVLENIVTPIITLDSISSFIVSPDEKYIYLRQYYNEQINILALDLSTNRIIKTLSTLNIFSNLLISPDGEYLYAISNGELIKIQIANGFIAETISFQNSVSSNARIAITPNGSHIYVPFANQDKICVVDTFSHKIVKTIATGNGPLDIAFSPNGEKAYITNVYGDSITVLE